MAWHSQVGQTQASQESPDRPEGKYPRSDRWLTIYMGGRKLKLFADTGSKFSIITLSMYHSKMGEVVAANCILREGAAPPPWTSRGCSGQKLGQKKGEKRRSWVYIVGSYKPEPLLGDRDTKALAIVTFKSEGREPKQSKLEEVHMVQKLKERSLPEKLCAAGFTVNISKSREEAIKQEDKEKAMAIVKIYHSTLFLVALVVSRRTQ